MEEAPKHIHLLKELRDWILVLVVAVGITLLLRHFICDFPIVDGNSMQDTLQNGERMAVSKLDFLWNPPRRGDVVICYYPETSVHKGLLVKRIVAVGGDTVRIESGQLYVNGVAIDEPYITRPASRNFREYTVPEEHYFVMGDNRDHSDDSRNPQIGALPRDMIEGRVQAVFWPLTALRAIERYDNYAALENP